MKNVVLKKLDPTVLYQFTLSSGKAYSGRTVELKRGVLKIHVETGTPLMPEWYAMLQASEIIAVAFNAGEQMTPPALKPVDRGLQDAVNADAQAREVLAAQAAGAAMAQAQTPIAQDQLVNAAPGATIVAKA